MLNQVLLNAEHQIFESESIMADLGYRYYRGPPTFPKIGIHFFAVRLLRLEPSAGMTYSFFRAVGRPTNPPRLAGVSAFLFDNTDRGHA